MAQLPPEQHYVLETAQKLGIETKLVYLPKATDTCYQKANLLQQMYPDEGWIPERVIKAMYFQRCDHIIYVVTPELGKKIPLEEILPRALGIGTREAREYRLAKPIPDGMELGTCTPFPLETSVGHNIHELIIYDYLPIDATLTDISIGGYGPEAHKVSMHLLYSGIYTILKHCFADRVHKASMITSMTTGIEKSKIPMRRQESFL